MTQNRTKFEVFRVQRLQELSAALGMVETLRDTIPLHRYISHVREITQEMRDLYNDGVIRLDHVKLMRSREVVK